MPRPSSALASILAVFALLSVLGAQEPAPGEIPQTGDIVVHTLVKVAGRIDPGQATEAEQAEPRIVDRVVEWQMLGRTFATPSELGKELQRVALDPKAMRPDEQTGGKKLATLRIVPDRATHWGEIVLLWDLVNHAGYRDLMLDGVDTWWLTAMAVAARRLDHRVLVLPSAVFNEPDEEPPPERLVFDVLRDGRIARDGRSLFLWKAGEAEDLEPLRKALREVRASMQAKKQLVSRKGYEHTVIDLPVLLRADRWAEWRDVLRLCRELLAPEVGYWKLQFAVVEPAPGENPLEQGR